MRKSPQGPYLRGYGRAQHLHSLTHLYRCPWCRRKRGLTHLELYGVAGFDAEHNAWRITYPRRESMDVVAVVSHPECGPDIGYALELNELDADLGRWYRHMRGKTWAPDLLEDIIWDVLLLHRKSSYRRFHPLRAGREDRTHAEP